MIPGRTTVEITRGSHVENPTARPTTPLEQSPNDAPDDAAAVVGEDGVDGPSDAKGVAADASPSTTAPGDATASPPVGEHGTVDGDTVDDRSVGGANTDDAARAAAGAGGGNSPLAHSCGGAPLPRRWWLAAAAALGATSSGGGAAPAAAASNSSAIACSCPCAWNDGSACSAGAPRKLAARTLPVERKLPEAAGPGEPPRVLPSLTLLPLELSRNGVPPPTLTTLALPEPAAASAGDAKTAARPPAPPPVACRGLPDVDSGGADDSLPLTGETTSGMPSNGSCGGAATVAFAGARTDGAPAAAASPSASAHGTDGTRSSAAVPDASRDSDALSEADPTEPWDARTTPEADAADAAEDSEPRGGRDTGDGAESPGDGRGREAGAAGPSAADDAPQPIPASWRVFFFVLFVRCLHSN